MEHFTEKLQKGDSVLIIGSRASGKTLLVKHLLETFFHYEKKWVVTASEKEYLQDNLLKVKEFISLQQLGDFKATNKDWKEDSVGHVLVLEISDKLTSNEIQIMSEELLETETTSFVTLQHLRDLPKSLRFHFNYIIFASDYHTGNRVLYDSFPCNYSYEKFSVLLQHHIQIHGFLILQLQLSTPFRKLFKYIIPNVKGIDRLKLQHFMNDIC